MSGKSGGATFLRRFEAGHPPATALGQSVEALAFDGSVPVLVLGGKENALSLVRNLGRHGVSVRASGPANCWGMYSRFCAEAFKVPRGTSPRDFWKALLLNPAERGLDGHILLTGSDEAIEFVAEHHDALARRYRMTEEKPTLQQALLDKRKTLELARTAGVGAPNFWTIDKDTDLHAIQSQITYPVMVKPIHSHKFTRVFGCKLFIVENSFDELVEKVRLAQDNGLEVMLVEMVPGPDSLLSSYYTYIDGDGRHLFHFTKRIIRRFPVNRGGACCHATQWLPETAIAGRKFFQGIGFRGLGNIEFKRDPRDGKLKIIESNARFTAAQELLVAAGAPIDLIIYCHLTGQPAPYFKDYIEHLTFWYPFRDFLAFLEMRRRGELTLIEWLKSVASFRHVYPLWDRGDPFAVFGVMRANAERLFRGP